MRSHKRLKKNANKQKGKSLVRKDGDYCQISYPDGGARPLKQWILRYRARMRDGFGSHQNGKHKMG